MNKQTYEFPEEQYSNELLYKGLAWAKGIIKEYEPVGEQDDSWKLVALQALNKVINE